MISISTAEAIETEYQRLTADWDRVLFKPAIATDYSAEPY